MHEGLKVVEWDSSSIDGVVDGGLITSAGFHESGGTDGIRDVKQEGMTIVARFELCVVHGRNNSATLIVCLPRDKFVRQDGAQEDDGETTWNH